MSIGSLTRTGVLHPYVASAAAVLACLVSALAIAEVAHPRVVGRAFDHLRPGWLVLALALELLSLPSYAAAYRRVVQRYGRHQLTVRLTVRLVLAGFGAFTLLGGFSLDKRALRLLGADRRGAGLSVLALGLLELSILAPVACLAATILLCSGSTVMGSMLWPWAIGVPVGAFAFSCLAEAVRVGWLGRSEILRDVTATVGNIVSSRDSLSVLAAMSLYFLAELGALGFCLRAFGSTVGPGRLIIAYSSGYVMTRRTLPIGSAGFVEVLLTLSLVWVGERLALALVAVVAYRLLNLVMVALLAFVARATLAPTMQAAAALEDRP